MSVDKLVVRLDAVNIIPRSLSPAIHQDVSIYNAQAQAFKEGVWIEPYGGILMIEPLQFKPDAYKNTDIVRNGKAFWIVEETQEPIGDHWDEVQREEERWLLSDGTNELIESLRTFPKNASFYLKFQLFGTKDDLYDALEVYFGQWKLRIHTNGATWLYKVGEDFSRTSASLGGPTREKLTDTINELVIMPMGNGKLYIRRNGVAGFVYTLPDNELTGDAPIIERGSVKIKALASRIRFELTQLRWPTDLCYFASPNIQLARAPTAEQLIGADFDSDLPFEGPGLIMARVYDPWIPGETSDLIFERVFSPDGEKTECCVGITLLGNENSSPMVQTIKVSAEPVSPDSPATPDEITYDVMSCKFSCGDSVLDTVATITIREPENHPIFGACNRACWILAGDQEILFGLLKEPPKYSHSSDGVPYYTCEIQSLAKYLGEQNLTNPVTFDGVPNSEAVTWLCRLAGLYDSDLLFTEDTTPLPDTRKQNEGSGETKSELAPDFADTAIDWLEKICDLTCWQFTDGYNESGTFVLKYVDPFDLSTTPIWTFVLHSVDEIVDYQRLRAWHPYSVEPECNELYFFGLDVNQQVIGGRYWDRQSQDFSLPEEERPDNWLGIRRVVVAIVEGTCTPVQLQALALRCGREICKRRDFAQFEADYPVGLWKGDVVSILDPLEEEPATGDYRILSISAEFLDESMDVPNRRATYEAVKVN